jgi:moderate conductance mechanosensitive channel
VHPQVLVAGPGTPASPSSTASLFAACGRTQNPGIACRLVWDVTHSTKAASLTMVYFAGPAQLAIRIGYVLLIAVVLRVIAHRAIRKITSRATKNDSDGSDRTHALLFRERRQQRASALGAILSNAASLTIFGVAGVIIIGDMGLNLAPVLASTAVLGVAIGFGAQNLVQDFLAGIFMLLEDQYGVGDVISVGRTTGTVEGVSLRITRLRDVNGIVWHIRNGTIKKAGNESQGWARAVVDFPVPYQRDIPAVRQVMRQTAEAMWQDPAWHELILEEPEVWGVQELSTDNVLMRITARTVPLRQWEVQRELTERLKLALDATGTMDRAALGNGSEATEHNEDEAGATHATDEDAAVATHATDQDTAEATHGADQDTAEATHVTDEDADGPVPDADGVPAPRAAPPGQ